MKFKENQPYKITMPNSKPFTAYYSYDTSPDDDFTCDICESEKKHRTKKHAMSVFVTTLNDEIPQETASYSNITRSYFFGNTCIKKITITEADNTD